MILVVLGIIIIILLIVCGFSSDNTNSEVVYITKYSDGYRRVSYSTISNWAKGQIRDKQRLGYRGNHYFNGRTYRYKVYFRRNGSFKVYRKIK